MVFVTRQLDLATLAVTFAIAAEFASKFADSVLAAVASADATATAANSTYFPKILEWIRYESFVLSLDSVKNCLTALISKSAKYDFT